MDTWKAGVLGLVQGFTEFLPVSSSGHLVIAREILGLGSGGLTFDVLVHFGTLVAVIASFRSTIWAVLRAALGPRRSGNTGSIAAAGQGARSLLAGVIVATVPAGIAGWFLRDALEPLFGSVRVVGLMLLVTGLVLWLGDVTSAHRRPDEGTCGGGRGGELTLWRAGAIGLAQALALLPGLSRSGLTISAGRMAGLSAGRSAEFSFLAAIPVIGGATLLEAADVAGSAGHPGQVGLPGVGAVAVAVGVVTSFLAGCVAIRLVMGLSRRETLMPFAWYCWLVGLASLVMGFVR